MGGDVVTGNRRVVFARINRRRGDQETLEARPFTEDIRALAESHLTRHVQRAKASRPARRWFAADMAVTNDGDFLQGTLGYSERQEQREFDTDAWSWAKGATHQADAGNEQTVVPFSIDIRPDDRWVAFATAARMQPAMFCSGFERVLNQAVADLGLIATSWEVDLITSRDSVDQWLSGHPDVHFFRRTVKFTNPGRDLDDDRREMQALAARRKTEEFAARYNRTLNARSSEFKSLLEGTETGDLELVLKARGVDTDHVSTFNSTERPDEELITEFANDLQLGMELTLAALRGYLRRRESGGRRTRDLFGD
ncbi:hypothetical protein GALL_330290 [mine drainage metagenome]|uniref:Uncharacterized protein n=1 Tax=mine drainage metagenome TaxID=410659 RepID=A0A1J5QZ68_9ZZZZ